MYKQQQKKQQLSTTTTTATATSTITTSESTTVCCVRGKTQTHQRTVKQGTKSHFIPVALPKNSSFSFSFSLITINFCALEFMETDKVRCFQEKTNDTFPHLSVGRVYFSCWSVILWTNQRKQSKGALYTFRADGIISQMKINGGISEFNEIWNGPWVIVSRVFIQFYHQ